MLFNQFWTNSLYYKNLETKNKRLPSCFLIKLQIKHSRHDKIFHHPPPAQIFRKAGKNKSFSFWSNEHYGLDTGFHRFLEQKLLNDIDCYWAIWEYLIQFIILGLGRKARASRSIWYQLQLCQKLETTFVLLSAAHRPLILTLNNVAPYNTSTSSSSNTSSIQYKCTMGSVKISIGCELINCVKYKW